MKAKIGNMELEGTVQEMATFANKFNGGGKTFKLVTETIKEQEPRAKRKYTRRSTRSNHYRWTPAELAFLKRSLANNRSYKYMKQRLPGRSKAAVKTQCSQIRLGHRK